MPDTTSPAGADPRSDLPRIAQSHIYAERACKALADAEATNLPNVRNRHITAAKRWIALAEQARRMELRHVGQNDPETPAKAP